MDACLALIAPFLGKAAGWITEEIGFFCHSKELVDKYKEERVRLCYLKDDLERRVKVSSDAGEVIKLEVNSWMESYNDFISNVKDCKESTCQRWCIVGCPIPAKRYFEGKKASKYTKKMDDLRKNGTFDAVSYKDSRPWVFSNNNFEDFRSREIVTNFIFDALKSPNKNLIGLYGLPGVGKTTLVIKIAKQAKKKKIISAFGYSKVGDIRDSDSESVLKRIQGDIANQFGINLENDSAPVRSQDLKYKLRIRTMPEESRGSVEQKRKESVAKDIKYLVILDDVWNEIKLENIGILSNESCKVLIISNTNDLFKGMYAENTFQMSTLTEDESRSFFKKMVGDSFENPKLKNLPCQVADRCGGIPFLLEHVANNLKGAEFNSWKDAHEQLKKIDNDSLETKTFTALKLNFNKLKNEELRTLFLLCGQLWRSGIPQEYLLYYAMGLDFIQNCKSYIDFKTAFFRLLGELRDTCLLKAGNGKDLMSMDSVVHSFAESCGSKNQHIFMSIKDDEWTKNDLLEKCYWLLISSDTRSSLPSFIQYSKLQALIMLASKFHFNEDFFDKMKELKVLDITGMNLSTLPSSFQNLLKLQTLCLHKCTLSDVKAVGNLWELKILSFAGSNITNLPIELGQLTNLEILNIENCEKLEHIPPNLLLKLKNLRDLLMDNSFSKWETDDSAVTPTNAKIDEISFLTKLVALRIRIPNAPALYSNKFPKNLDEFRILIGECEDWDSGKNKTFQVTLDDNTQLSPSLMSLLKSAEYVSISKLAIESLKEDSAEIDLMVDSMEQDLPNRSFINIEILHLHDCDKLKTLFPVFGARCLPKLQELKVKDCNNLKAILEDNGPSITNDEVFHLPELRKLKLKRLPSLSGLLFDKKIALPNLEELVVNQINAKNLMTYAVATCMSQLNTLEINDCQILEEVVCSEENISSEISFPKLENLYLQYLMNLIRFCDCDHVNFGSLHSLIIYVCPKMVSFNGCSSAFFKGKVTMPSLNELLIHGVDSIKMLWHNEIDQDSFGNLKELSIGVCSSLENLGGLSFIKNVKVLKVHDCSSLKVIIKDNETSTNMLPLPCLESLKLSSLKELESFCAGVNKIECRSLQKFLVYDCKLNVNNLQILQSLHSLSLNKADEESFLKTDISLENVKTLQLQNFRGKSEIFPTDLVQRFSGMNKLILRDCDFEEISNLNGQITTLKLYGVEFLRNFMDQSLTKLTICKCHSLRFLFTPESARSFQQLVYLDVQDCNSLSEIMRNEGHSEDVIFRKLEEITLGELQSLRCFTDAESSVKFPSLQYLYITKCPAMNVFSKGHATAPMLDWLYLEDNDIKYRQDLNKTLQLAYAEQQ